MWYSTGSLFGVLEKRVPLEDFDLVVGLTHLPLARTDSAGTVIDKNYFSLSDLGKLSLVSTHSNVMTFKSEWKTEDQYVAYLIAGELLINLAGQDLMHLLANNCLFDDCVDRTRLAQCMNKSHICAQCSLKLKKASISKSVILEVESLLQWCKKTKARTALAYSLNHPVTGFSVGIGLGWFTSIFITGEHYALMLMATLALPTFLFVRKWVFK